MDSIDDASLSSPVAIRKLVMPIGRGLSTLVKNLRDMEDERLDEELDIMRELEAGDEATGPPKEKKQTPMLLVEDSQQAEMPLGPDQAPESEEEEDEGNYTRDGRPLKIWKKKGQRRTTRRVNMKPSTAKWKPEPQWNAANGSDSEVEGHTNMVNDTELDPSNQAQTAQNSDSDSDVHQGDERPSASDEKEPQNGRKRTGQKAKETTKQGTDAKSLGQKLKRKMISATAHANFRSLKIRNKNSKGRSGRFGRRR